MERKSGNSAVAVRTARSKTLTSEEEKVLRMRQGSKVDLGLPVGSGAAGKSEELADELLVLEMELFRAQRAALSARRPRNPTKEKIVRALRKKK